MFLKFYFILRILIMNILMGKFCMFAISSEMVNVDSIKDAEKYFTLADEKTVILFDIDSTITTPSDPYWRRHAIQRHQQIYQKYVFGLTQGQMRILSHLIVVQSPSQLVENEWPKLINSLRKRGIKMLALTASKTGSLGSCRAPCYMNHISATCPI